MSKDKAAEKAETTQTAAPIEVMKDVVMPENIQPGSLMYRVEDVAEYSAGIHSARVRQLGKQVPGIFLGGGIVAGHRVYFETAALRTVIGPEGKPGAYFVAAADVIAYEER